MHRTDTRDKSVFNLTYPQAVTLQFPADRPIRISVPKGTRWSMPLHWHFHGTGCISLKCIDGPLNIYYAWGPEGSCNQVCGPGSEKTFRPGDRMAFNCSRRDKNTRVSLFPLMVDLDADHSVWRNVCSATLDRDLFPGLSSTPYWLKALFAFLSLFPRAREALLSSDLWIQTQAIFYGHDFHTWHGFVPVTWPWIAQIGGGHAPRWAYELQLWSVLAISRVVMAASCWGGRLFCGIHGEYAAYTPARMGTEARRKETLEE